jgi:hypothetical protein
MSFEEIISKADPIALWGAILSTLLAITKFWELWKDRTNIEVSYNFTGSDDIGNEVIIRNLATTPIIITYWELIWRDRKLFYWKETSRIAPDEFFSDIKLSGHTSTKLTFKEIDHFDWSPSALGTNKIFLRVHIAGKRRPIVKYVYGN